MSERIPERQEDPVLERLSATVPADEDYEGGDPVCWAHLVCPECGAITSEGHRAGCAAGPAGPAPV